MRITIIFLLVVCTGPLAGAYTDSLRATQILQQARDLIKAGGDDREITALTQEGFQILNANGDHVNWLVWHRKVGRQWRLAERYEKAIHTLNIGLTWLSEHPVTNPEEYYDVRSRLQAEMGTVYYNLNEFNIAKDYYHHYIELLEGPLDKPAFYTARYAYSRIGNIYSGLRDIEQAVYYHEKVRTISRAEGQWWKWAQACSDMALAYGSIYEYEQAISELEVGLRMWDSLAVEEQLLLLLGTGLNYYHLDDLPNARYYTEQAEVLYEQKKTDLSRSDQASFNYELQYNYGRIQKKEKNFPASERSYETALQIVQEGRLNNTRRKMVIMHLNFGQLYLEWGRYEQALSSFTAAIEQIVPVSMESAERYTGPLAAEPLLAHALEMLGTTCAKQFEGSLSDRDLQNAFQFYEQSQRVRKQLLVDYTTDESRLAALKQQRKLQSKIMDVSYSQYLLTSSDELAATLFEISDNSRAHLMREIARINQEVRNWPEANLQNYQALKVRLADLEQEIFFLKEQGAEADHLVLDSLRRTYMQVNHDLTLIRNEVLEASRDVDQASRDLLPQIQASLGDQQAMIEYFVAEDYLYIFSIWKSDFRVMRKELPKHFNDLVTDFRNTLILTDSTDFQRSEEQFAQLGSELYRLLLADPLTVLPELVDRLIFIRDGVLNYLPLAIIPELTVKPGTPFFKMPYLLRKFSCSNASSASLLLLQKQLGSGRAKQRFAGYAPEYTNALDVGVEQSRGWIDGDTLSLSPLPGAHREVRQVADLMNGRPFFDQNASERHFKEHASEYQILLLSMHAILNATNPQFSKFMFTENSSDGREDDKLTAVELSSLKLFADLVVLSACQTGIGRLYSGEGVMNLSRAFFEAGVPSAVMSLWQVADDETANVIIKFFAELSREDGITKDVALKNAQMAYLNQVLEEGTSPREAHPYYWSGLLITGDDASLDLIEPKNNLLPVLLLLLVLGLASYILKLRKDRK